MSRPKLVGLALAIATTLAVLVNQRSVGLARDELVYMGAGARYADWWIGLVTFQHGPGPVDVDKTWGGAPGGGNNTEHPPLMKTLFGLSHELFSGVLGEVTSYRLPSAVMHGVLAWLVFLMTLELWGLAEAIAAVLALLLLPRALFHAGLACFDAPIMTLWFATVYAYWRCLDGRKWPWQAGVVFGLALATKHTAVLLPFGLLVHYAIVASRAVGWQRALLWRWRLVVSVALLGPITLIVLWPWLWWHPFAHIAEWMKFHLTHVHYNYEYLGQNWNAPRFPWHVALVTTLFTVPVATLAAAATGTAAWIARRAQVAEQHRATKPVLLLGISAAVSIAPFVVGTTPIFGAEKHWMPILPTICIAAGVGAVWAARLALPARPREAAIAVVTLIALAGATEAVTARPYALTWYNALAGGAPGGADKGMNRQFWGVAAKGVLPVLAEHAPATGTAPVYSHDASPAWGMYIKHGLIPPSLPDAGMEVAGIEHSKLALVIHELHFNRHDYLIWRSYGTVRPIFVLRADGVPIVSVYARP